MSRLSYINSVSASGARAGEISQQFSFWLKALPYLGFAAGMLRGVDTGINPFEPQREGVFPAPPPDSAGNARPSPRWGGPFGPARDRLIPAYHGVTIA